MAPMWFVYTNELVSGPFDTEQLRSQIASGVVHAKSFVWWKGQREWIPLETWQSQLQEILKVTSQISQSPVWYIDRNGQSLGPLTQNELIQNLRSIENLSSIRLWAVGMKDWTKIYELQDIMEVLGLSRRENPRAPLMGSVAATRSNDDPKGYMLKAASISVSGVGLTGQHDLRTGDELSLLIKSPEFVSSLHLHASIAYVTKQGYIGARFRQVHPETKSMIFDYVKKFNLTHQSTTTAA